MGNVKDIKKKGVVPDYLVWIIIALAVLAIGFISLSLLKGGGDSFIDKIIDLFRR